MHGHLAMTGRLTKIPSGLCCCYLACGELNGLQHAQNHCQKYLVAKFVSIAHYTCNRQLPQQHTDRSAAALQAVSIAGLELIRRLSVCSSLRLLLHVPSMSNSTPAIRCLLLWGRLGVSSWLLAICARAKHMLRLHNRVGAVQGW